MAWCSYNFNARIPSIMAENMGHPVVSEWPLPTNNWPWVFPWLHRQLFLVKGLF